MDKEELTQINVKLSKKQKRSLQDIANKKTDGDISRLIRSIADWDICLVHKIKSNGN